MSKKNIILVSILALLITLGYYYTQKPKSTLAGAISNFAIKDTASIQKIHIADLQGNNIVLERQSNGSWKLNGKYFAREDAVNNILKTAYRISVQGPVANTMRTNVLKRLSTVHKMVEFYTDDPETPFKTYYVGDATMNHMGTFMLLETAAEGRSSEPFIMEDYSVKGYLTPRFFTRLDEWRNTILFNYPTLAIKRIEVELYETPEQSFSMTYEGENNIKLYDYQLKPVENFKIDAAKFYLQQYKKINFESYVETKVSKLTIDSITQHTPHFEIRVFPENGENEFITLWRKDVGILKEDRFGYTVNHDTDRMWGRTHMNNFVFAQYFTFDRLLVPISFFTEE